MPCGHGGDSRGAASSAATGGSECKAETRGPKVHTSFRINPVVELFSKMDGEKEMLLKEVGLHGLTQLPREDPTSNRSFNWQFAFWLLMKLDSETGELDLGIRGRLDMRCEDVGLVLGIPSSGEELRKSDPLLIKTTKQEVKKQMLIDAEEELDLESVRKILEQSVEGDDEAKAAKRKAFITASFIFAVSYFLAPKGRPAKVNNDILECLLDTSNIRKINWGSYVLMSLREASKKLKKEVSANTKSVTLDGCLLLLQVVYLDNLDFGLSSIRHDVVPRVKDFSLQVLNKLIDADKGKRGGSSVTQYGFRKIRGDHDTSYTRGDMYRAILLSKDRIARGAIQEYDKDQMLAYVKKNVEEGKRKIRLASRQFEEQACDTMDQSHQNIAALLDVWITRRMQCVVPREEEERRGKEICNLGLYIAPNQTTTQENGTEGSKVGCGGTNTANSSSGWKKRKGEDNGVSQGRTNVTKRGCR